VNLKTEIKDSMKSKKKIAASAPPEAKPRRMRCEYGPSDFQRMMGGLKDAAVKIEREMEREELSNYFEVLRFFQNPPYDENLIE
jgi:hypothetical protein